MTIENLNLQEMFQSIREEFSSRLRSRRINWIEHDHPLEIRADKESLTRVLRNLVDNALKYGGEGLSQIELGCNEAPGSYILWVRDNGAGFGNEDTAKYFQLFVRRESSRKTEGTGLGLAIVKEIAERHQGKVWTESLPEKGTTFFVSLARDLSVEKGGSNPNSGERRQRTGDRREETGERQAWPKVEGKKSGLNEVRAGSDTQVLKETMGTTTQP